MFRRKAREKEEEPTSPTPPQPSYGGQADITGGSVDTSGKGGIIDKFSTSRRRFKENFAQRAGKDAADNTEFEERAERVGALREKMVKIRDAMKQQLDCSRALCLSCADLGNACSDADIRDVQFQNTQYQLDEDIRKRLDESIVKALESLDNKLTPFAEIEKMIVSRSRLKLDYDHYARKVRDLKERPGSDVTKLSNNEAKLTSARQRLQEATSRLYKGFGYYDAIGGRLCQPEIEIFKKAQQDFFGAAVAAVKDMPTRDPQDVAREIEAAGQDGMNTPFTLPTSDFSSTGGGLTPTQGIQSGVSSRSFAESPDPTPTSAYVPSSSAPWMTNTGGTRVGTGIGGVSAASKSPGARSGGSSWWDKHASTSESQAPSSGWRAGGGGPAAAAPSQSGQQAKALFSYTAADNTELSLVEGETLTIITQDQSGWWTGQKGGRKGLLPSNYVTLL